MSKLKNLALLIISIIAVMLIGISISYAADLEDESQTKDWVPNSAYVLYTKGEGTVHYLSAEDLYYGRNLLCAEVKQEIAIHSVGGDVAYKEDDVHLPSVQNILPRP